MEMVPTPRANLRALKKEEITDAKSSNNNTILLILLLKRLLRYTETTMREGSKLVEPIDVLYALPSNSKGILTRVSATPNIRINPVRMK